MTEQPASLLRCVPVLTAVADGLPSRCRTNIFCSDSGFTPRKGKQVTGQLSFAKKLLTNEVLELPCH